MNTIPIIQSGFCDRSGNRTFSFVLCRRRPVPIDSPNPRHPLTGIESVACVLIETGKEPELRAIAGFSNHAAILRLANHYLSRSIPNQF